ncbi:hypothetical protein DFJ77DRAFT_342466 [Powellomyces hirtus]|nr:hypothetical protein DFJ77DRAFT_342466 [Powellomyces hirtus]
MYTAAREIQYERSNKHSLRSIYSTEGRFLRLGKMRRGTKRQKTDATEASQMVTQQQRRTAEQLCDKLRSALLGFSVASSNVDEFCDILDTLRHVLYEMASTRRSEGSAEAIRDREDIRAVIATVSGVLNVRCVRVRVGALRILGSIIKPTGLKVRNPVFARNEIVPLYLEPLRTADRDSGHYTSSAVQILFDVFHGQQERLLHFYILKILVAICKVAVGRVIPLIPDPTGSTVAAVLNELVTARAPLVDKSAVAIEVPTLAVTFVRQILKEGISPTPGGLTRIDVFESLVGAIGSFVSTEVSDGMSSHSVNLTDTNRKFLSPAVSVLYLLCKRDSEMVTRLGSYGVSALLTILEQVASSSSLDSLVSDDVSEGLDMAKGTCQILLMVMKSTQTFETLGQDILSLQMVQSITEYARMLSESRPSIYLILPVLDLLLLCLPRTTETLRSGIRAQITLILLKLWKTIDSSAYVQKYKAPDVERAQDKILKLLTFIINEEHGIEQYAQTPPELLSLFHAKLVESIESLLLGTTTGERRFSAPDSGDKANANPSLGLRALRLISVAMNDRKCRTKLVDEGLLQKLIDVRYGPQILDAQVELPLETMHLLFVTLQRAAENSGIRYKMRDGKFGREVTHEGLDGVIQPIRTACAQTSGFTVVHFCVQLLVCAAAASEDKSVAPWLSAYRESIMQRSMTFLYENYGHDSGVAEVVCSCPLALFGVVADRVPETWVSRRSVAAGVVSVFPVILRLVTTNVNILDLDLHLSSEESAESSNADKSRLAAAGLLDSLIGVGKAQSQLLTPATLSKLADSLTPLDEASPVSRILVRVLGRLIATPELLRIMIENLGFSAIFEPLVRKELAQPGEGAVFLTAFGNELAKTRNETVLRLFKFYCTSPNSNMAASVAFREKLAISMAFYYGSTMVPKALSSDPMHSAALDLLLSMALRGQTSNKGLEGNASSEHQISGHAIMALRYLCWTSRSFLDLSRTDHFEQEIYLPRVVDFLSLSSKSSLCSPNDKDATVTFVFPDEPGTAPVQCHQAAFAAASPALKAILEWPGYHLTDRHAPSQDVHIRGVLRSTWNLMLAYHQTAPQPPTRPRADAHSAGCSALSHIRAVTALAECADQYLCDTLLEDCLHYIYLAATECVKHRDGPRALFIRDWAVAWKGAPGGVGEDWMARIDDMAFRGMVVGLVRLCEAFDGD